MKPEFAIAGIATGQLNAMVKRAMQQTGISNPVEAVRQYNAGEWELVKAKLLRPLGTYNVPAGKFNSKNVFITGKWYLGSNFKNSFLVDTEVDVPAITLRTQELIRGSRNQGIRAELGVELEEILLGHFLSFLMQADRSKRYVAYIKNVQGKLWAVNAVWYVDGWSVDAGSVEDPFGCRAGRVIVSR